MRGRLKVSLPWLDGHLRKVGSTGSVSARASKYRCAELKRPVTQAASKMPSNATVLRRSQFSSARAVARDLTEPINLGATWGDAALRLPGIHLVFSLVKRWLLGTHHGAVGEKHLPAYLDENVFRFNRRPAKRISHGFARLVEHAVRIEPTSYRDLVAPPAPA